MFRLVFSKTLSSELPKNGNNAQIGRNKETEFTNSTDKIQASKLLAIEKVSV